MADEIQPYAEEWLQFEAMTGGRFNLTGDIPSIRAQFLALFSNMKDLLPPATDAVTITDARLPNSDVPIRIYTPTTRSDKPLSIGLYLHSGGWVAGGANYEDHLCSYYVQHTPTILISPSYRLAPEHIFPAGLDDCFAVWEWIGDNAATYNADPELAYVIGGSAGANLGLAVTLRTLSTPGARVPRALFASCTSCIEPSAIPERYRKDWKPERFLDSAFLDRECMQTCIAAYAAPPTDPLFACLLHPELARLPPTYLVACGKDPTYTEIVMLRDEMAALGCEVELKVYEGYPHFFFVVPVLGMSRVYLEDIAGRIRGLGGESGGGADS